MFFEDNGNDVISKLFRSYYKYMKNINVEQFVYAKGNGNIPGLIQEQIKYNNKTYIVFMDFVYDNHESVKVYDKLWRLSRQNDYRIIVLGVPCAEYCMLKSINRSYLIKNRDLYDIAINRDLYFKLCNNLPERVKNFERYCKFVLRDAVYDCVSLNSEDNKYYTNYYTRDCCECLNQKECNIDLSTITKSQELILAYNVFPAVNDLGISMTEDILWRWHRYVIDDFNMKVDYFKHNDNRGKVYEKIKYIK